MIGKEGANALLQAMEVNKAVKTISLQGGAKPEALKNASVVSTIHSRLPIRMHLPTANAWQCWPAFFGPCYALKMTLTLYPYCVCPLAKPEDLVFQLEVCLLQHLL